VGFGVEDGERGARVHGGPEGAVFVDEPDRPCCDLMVARQPALFGFLGCVLHVASSLRERRYAAGTEEGGGTACALELGLLNGSNEHPVKSASDAGSVSRASHLLKSWPDLWALGYSSVNLSSSSSSKPSCPKNPPLAT